MPATRPIWLAVSPSGTQVGWPETRSVATSAAYDVPVFVANDANTAVLGEHTFGASGDGGLMSLGLAGLAWRRRAALSEAAPRS